MRFRDLLSEAFSGITRRTGRASLTALGTVLGVGALVATLGLTTTAAAQISQRFDILKATKVLVKDTDAESDLGPALTERAESQVRRLNGVEAAGLMWTVKADGLVSLTDPRFGLSHGTSAMVQAVSPGALEAMEPVMSFGRPYPRWQDGRAERVAVIGAAVANRLGLHDNADEQAALLIDGRRFTISGVVQDVERSPALLVAVAVPPSTALELWGETGRETAEVLIRTRLGAAQLIAKQAPLAIYPQDPARLFTITAPDPKSLRQGVESDVDALFVLLALVSLAIGAISIANTTLVSVLERVPEIGLRRALGGSRRSIGAQFLTESAILGTAGGLAGACAGAIAVVGVCLAKQWTPVIDPLIILAAPFLGTVTGLMAGVYPSLKAARVEPVQALRR